MFPVNEVAFKAVDREVQITKKFGDIEASFFDPAAKELVCPIQSIGVKGEALYNKFSIKPTHINFGPCMYRQKKQATFDVTSIGECSGKTTRTQTITLQGEGYMEPIAKCIVC